MDVDTALEVAFAAGILVAAAALAAAFLGRAGKRALVAATTVVGVGAVAAWVGFASELDRESALAAAGLTVCFAACFGSLGVLAGVLRSRRLDDQLATADARLNQLIHRESSQRAEELERTLARARADSASLLAEEERRISDARRTELMERERRVSAQLGGAPTRAGRPGGKN